MNPPTFHNTAKRPGSSVSSSYWSRVRRLTLVLLGVWFGVTFGIVFFARELSTFTIFGWPLSFYMAAQGGILVYVLIVAIYAWRMRRLDRMVSNETANGK